jgi:hypothetical protein
MVSRVLIAVDLMAPVISEFCTLVIFLNCFCDAVAVIRALNSAKSVESFQYITVRTLSIC